MKLKALAYANSGYHRYYNVKGRGTNKVHHIFTNHSMCNILDIADEIRYRVLSNDKYRYLQQVLANEAIHNARYEDIVNEVMKNV